MAKKTICLASKHKELGCSAPCENINIKCFFSTGSQDGNFTLHSPHCQNGHATPPGGKFNTNILF